MRRELRVLLGVVMVVGGGVKKGLDIQLDMVAASLGGNSRRLQ